MPSHDIVAIGLWTVHCYKLIIGYENVRENVGRTRREEEMIWSSCKILMAVLFSCGRSKVKREGRKKKNKERRRRRREKEREKKERKRVDDKRTDRRTDGRLRLLLGERVQCGEERGAKQSHVFKRGSVMTSATVPSSTQQQQQQQ